MKKFILILSLIFFANLSASAEILIQQNPELPLPATVFNSKFAVTTPYWVKINNTKYYLVKNRVDGNYSYRDFVGCDKPKRQLFMPFAELDSDGDRTKLTSEELKKADVRLVAEKINGKLALSDTSKDFPLEEVLYIDMMTLATFTDRYTRPFGKFSIYIKTDSGRARKYTGHVSFQRQRYLEQMF